MPSQTHNSSQSRLKIMPNRAKKISQIRLKSGDYYEANWKENPVILSTQSRTKASDTPTTRRSKLGAKTRKLNAL